MARAMNPIICEIHAKKSQDPSVGRVPGESDDVQSLVHPDVRCELHGPEQQPGNTENKYYWICSGNSYAAVAQWYSTGFTSKGLGFNP